MKIIATVQTYIGPTLHSFIHITVVSCLAYQRFKEKQNMLAI